jgi:hypothetical protein
MKTLCDLNLGFLYLNQNLGRNLRIRQPFFPTPQINLKQCTSLLKCPGFLCGIRKKMIISNPEIEEITVEKGTLDSIIHIDIY